MNKIWIATITLISTPFFTCQSSGAPEPQAPKTEASTPAAGASERIKEISTSQLKDWMTSGQKFTLIHVREDNEWQAGHAATAMHISRGTLAGRIRIVLPDKTARIVLLPGRRAVGGGRGNPSEDGLHERRPTGGFKNYQLAGLPIQQ